MLTSVISNFDIAYLFFVYFYVAILFYFYLFSFILVFIILFICKYLGHNIFIKIL